MGDLWQILTGNVSRAVNVIECRYCLYNSYPKLLIVETCPAAQITYKSSIYWSLNTGITYHRRYTNKKAILLTYWGWAQMVPFSIREFQIVPYERLLICFQIWLYLSLNSNQNMSSFIKIMAWHPLINSSLSELMMAHFPNVCVRHSLTNS